MGASELVLDQQVRDWVFIPLTISIVLMKLVMQYLHQMTAAGAAAPNRKCNPRELRDQATVQRSARLRSLGGVLPETSFKMRKDYFATGEKAVFAQTPVSKPMHEAMATDPSVMMGMMKQNLMGMVPQLAMGAWVSFFFSGFVMGRVPFALTPRFKAMLQRGIDLTTLDPSYFTSLSYYILLLFGLRGAFSLVFRDATVDDAELMRRQMNPMAAAGGAGFDAANAFKGEKAALAGMDHDWVFEDSEEEALRALKAREEARAGSALQPPVADGPTKKKQ